MNRRPPHKLGERRREGFSDVWIVELGHPAYDRGIRLNQAAERTHPLPGLRWPDPDSLAIRAQHPLEASVVLNPTGVLPEQIHPFRSVGARGGINF